MRLRQTSTAPSLAACTAAACLAIAGAAFFLHQKHDPVASLTDSMSAKCQKVDDLVQRSLCYRAEISDIARSDISTAIHTISALKDRGLLPECHTQMHAIGFAAYDRYVSTHSSDFMSAQASGCNYGLYHGFMISLFENDGNLKMARAFCDTLSSSLIREMPRAVSECYHGIGHGILNMYTGSTDGRESDPYWVKATLMRAAPQALAQCGSLSDVREDVRSCYAGVFHEVATLEEWDGWYTDANDPLWLCGKVADEYRSSCFGNMHRLFVHAYPDVAPDDLLAKIRLMYGDDESILKPVVWRYGFNERQRRGGGSFYLTYCRGIPEKAYRGSCMSGAVASALYNLNQSRLVDDAIRLCTDKELTDEERDDCMEQIYGFFRYSLPKSIFESACKLTSASRVHECETKQSGNTLLVHE